MKYCVKKINEPDFGCEGRPDNYGLMDEVILCDSNGKELIINISDEELLRNDICEGEWVIYENGIIERWYDYDASPRAFKCYEKWYKGKLVFDKKESKKRIYIESKFMHNGKMSEELRFSGETDFNFSDNGLKGQTRFDIFNKYLEGNKIEQGRLAEYKRRTRDTVNFSIMPSTGRLQQFKQGIGNDRFDTFIWAISEYYKREDPIILIFNQCTYENIEYLKSFLNCFSSIEDYCKTMYGINDKLTHRLIDSGREPIDSQERVIEYMDFAKDFWKQKFRG